MREKTDKRKVRQATKCKMQVHILEVMMGSSNIMSLSPYLIT